jgi:hypothetical protein
MKLNRNFFDVDKGALSDAENESIALALNEKSPYLFHVDSRVTLMNMRQFITLRLTHATARRAVQLSQLKWCDLSIEPHPIEHNYHLTMPMAKQGDAAPF